MNVAQVLDSGSGYISCRFRSDAAPDSNGNFPSFFDYDREEFTLVLAELKLSGGVSRADLA
jgi:hypothetical protein